MQITGETFKFPFKEHNWKGIAALGGLIGLIGMVLFPLLYLLNGFSIRVLRQTMRGESPSLPKWDDWRQIFKDTLWYCAVMIVYLLPAILIIVVIWMAMYAVMFIGPFGFGFVTTTGPMTPQAEQAATIGIIFIMVVFMGAMMIASLMMLPLQFFATVALTRAVAHQSLSRAFEIRNVWALLREGLGSFLVAFALGYGIQFGANLIGAMLAYTIILYCLYPIIFALGTMYSSLVMFALFGRAYREAQGKMAAAGVIA